MKPKQPPKPATTLIGVQAVLALAMLLASLGTSIANIALPSLAEAFSAPFSSVQAVIIVYLATLTTGVVAAGRLGDRFGLKRAMLAGLALFGTASIVCALAPTLGWLITARGLQGFGAAFLMTLSMALMRQTANAARVGQAMGLLGTVSALGTALGPSLGGLLIPTMGWRSIFWMQTPLAAITLIMAYALLPNETAAARPAPASFFSLLNRPLISSLVINLLVAAVMMTTLVVGPFYLGLGLGLNAMQVGLVMTIGPAVSILSGIPSGQIVDAWGSGTALTFGLILLAAGAVLLAVLPGLYGVVGYIVAIAMLTPGYQLFQAANNTAALADIPKDQRGIVSGILSLSRNMGLIAGASAMGAVFAYGVGTADVRHATPAAIADGMQLTFLLAGLLIVLAIGVNLSGKGLARALHPATQKPHEREERL